MPASICFWTVSATALRIRAAYTSWSHGSPAHFAFIRSSRSFGRGRLPQCVVRMRSVLRFIVDPPEWLLHRALGGVGVAVIGEDDAAIRPLELSRSILDDLVQVEVLDRKAVGVVPEGATHRLEVGATKRVAQSVLVLEVALRAADRAVDEERGVVGLGRVGRRRVAVLLLEVDHEALAGRVLEIRVPERRPERPDGGVADGG